MTFDSMMVSWAPRSLKKQLLLSLLTALVLVWTSTAYLSYQRTREEIAELFNAELAQSARVVHAFVENLLRQKRLSKLWDQDKSPDLFSMPILGHKYERKIAFQLRSVKEGVMLRSESAPEFALSLTRNGYSEAVLDGQLWHVFSIGSENGEYVIHVGQRDDIRQQLVSSLAGQQMLSLLLALPVLGLIIGLIVSRTLKPVNRLKEQLAAREAGHLQPLPLDHLPDEVVPMVKQINSLFAQLEQAFVNERHFTSDASHELRTPLAGLLTQLQVAQKTADASMREQALQKAQLAVARMTHLVQQLLTLARVQHQDTQLDKQSVDLHQAILGVIGELEPLAHEKHIELELRGEPGIMILASSQLLAILLRNLLDNAIKYTPAHGHVCVCIAPFADQCQVSFEDSGPGVAEEDFARLTQRFYRCVETARQAEGSGLGLSIVQRILSLHEADITFARSGWGGLKVTVRFNKHSILSAESAKGSAFGSHVL